MQAITRAVQNLPGHQNDKQAPEYRQRHPEKTARHGGNDDIGYRAAGNGTQRPGDAKKNILHRQGGNDRVHIEPCDDKAIGKANHRRQHEHCRDQDKTRSLQGQNCGCKTDHRADRQIQPAEQDHKHLPDCGDDQRHCLSHQIVQVLGAEKLLGLNTQNHGKHDEAKQRQQPHSLA